MRDDKGSTLVELVMVMMLLILFGFTTYTLIYAGSETQRKIIEDKDAQVDARIAISYLNVRLKSSPFKPGKRNSSYSYTNPPVFKFIRSYSRV